MTGERKKNHVQEINVISKMSKEKCGSKTKTQNKVEFEKTNQKIKAKTNECIKCDHQIINTNVYDRLEILFFCYRSTSTFRQNVKMCDLHDEMSIRVTTCVKWYFVDFYWLKFGWSVALTLCRGYWLGSCQAQFMPSVAHAKHSPCHK